MMARFSGVRQPHFGATPCACRPRAGARWVPCVAGRKDGVSLDSLVPQTLEEMEGDAELQAVLKSIEEEGQAALTKREQRGRQRSLEKLNMPNFSKACADAGVTPLKRGAAKILQLNIGLYCNQACTHCHVESSPKRTEMMSFEVANRCLELLDDAPSVATLDLTGGAPELNPTFRHLVEGARARGREVIDRCNLTVLEEPGQEDLADFLAALRVRVVASLPCYSQKNVDLQRGSGVFERSVRGLQKLNAVGYGVPGTGLTLDLVYNPGGPFLAPPQESLEGAYRTELREAFGVEFSSLLALNNMPIKRYYDWLERRGGLEEYMGLLLEGFNPGAAEGLMCRDTVSVGWDGRVYDCDFNQQLEMTLAGGSGESGLTVFDLGSLGELEGRGILVDNHCFGCTAGSGSGCQGATE
ncbi:unnamed protein product [Pedinophyceae sp. YPF-701]|nr:unnamed protein product [Pedinophyceae sp. YPF-701]